MILQLLSGNKGFTVIYECNNGYLGERKSTIMGCYSVGLEAFLQGATERQAHDEEIFPPKHLGALAVVPVGTLYE